MIPSTGYLRIGPDGRAQVDASLYLTDRSHIRCHIYADQQPILSLDDKSVSVSITTPGRDRLSAEDLVVARRLLTAVEDYVSELEQRFAKQGAADRAA